MDKPNPLIYSRALESGHLAPNEVLHVGNDPGEIGMPPRPLDWHLPARIDHTNSLRSAGRGVAAVGGLDSCAKLRFSLQTEALRGR